jgi:hypothetical protein
MIGVELAVVFEHKILTSSTALDVSVGVGVDSAATLLSVAVAVASDRRAI